jgi:hypothetical protein
MFRGQVKALWTNFGVSVATALFMPATEPGMAIV